MKFTQSQGGASVSRQGVSLHISMYLKNLLCLERLVDFMFFWSSASDHNRVYYITKFSLMDIFMATSLCKTPMRSF